MVVTETTAGADTGGGGVTGSAETPTEQQAVDNMATLPVSAIIRGGGGGGGGGGGSDVLAEKNNHTNKEMELKKVRPQPLKKWDKYIFTVSNYFITRYV